MESSMKHVNIIDIANHNSCKLNVSNCKNCINQSYNIN